MKGILKALSWPLWWLWVRYAYVICVFRTLDLELEQEELQGREVDTDLEIHMLRRVVRDRWSWGDPPSPVAAYLQKVADERAKELASRQ